MNCIQMRLALIPVIGKTGWVLDDILACMIPLQMRVERTSCRAKSKPEETAIEAEMYMFGFEACKWFAQ